MNRWWHWWWRCLADDRPTDWCITGLASVLWTTKVWACNLERHAMNNELEQNVRKVPLGKKSERIPKWFIVVLQNQLPARKLVSSCPVSTTRDLWLKVRMPFCANRTRIWSWSLLMIARRIIHGTWYRVSRWVIVESGPSGMSKTRERRSPAMTAFGLPLASSSVSAMRMTSGNHKKWGASWISWRTIRPVM